MMISMKVPGSGCLLLDRFRGDTKDMPGTELDTHSLYITANKCDERFLGQVVDPAQTELNICS